MSSPKAAARVAAPKAASLAALLSPARAEASRKNGAKSRGPRTPDGKARASRNALKHGMRAEQHVVVEGESAEAFAAFEAIDAAFERLAARLSGTESLLIATADHGFIDVAPEESLELPATLASLLRFPLCGERRVAYCHVHSEDEFLGRAKDWLGDRADVMPSRQLVEQGWFGPGVPHPRFAERVGDIALVMRGRYTVKDWTAGEPRHLHVGNHGGTSEDEMLIPLIMEAR
jgi:hypothetical protein